jgi:uncharacterized membrane protein
MKRLAWFFLVVSLVGFFVTFPLWLFNMVSDRTLLGITLVLSWAALWYAAALFIDNVKEMRELKAEMQEIKTLLKKALEGIPSSQE